MGFATDGGPNSVGDADDESTSALAVSQGIEGLCCFSRLRDEETDIIPETSMTIINQSLQIRDGSMIF